MKGESPTLKISTFLRETKINAWVSQWKINFSQDPNKVSQNSSQRYLGLVLDVRLTFEAHLRTILSKFNKILELLRKLQNIPPRNTP